MKITSLITLIIAGTITLGVVGCKKEEPIVKSPTEATEAAASQSADAIKDGTEKAVEQVKESATAATAAASDKIDSIIATAQKLVGEAKFQDALTALSDLKGMTLSEAQQKLVDGLKAQIQKALSGDAAAKGASAVGGLLGK